MTTTAPIVTIGGLKTHFFLDEGVVEAVEGVDLSIPRGRTLCLVGESGCGKSVTAFSVMRMLSSPGRIVDGTVTLHGEDGDVRLTDLAEDSPTMRAIRGRDMAMVFQEPMTSLSPVHTVGSQIVEAVRLHTDLGRRQARLHAIDMMRRVSIPDPESRFGAYPHELSGGLRQRAMIAMALSCRPALLIADEPTTALDVTIQAQILALMRQLQEEGEGMAILLITHDLGVVAQMAHEVAVMYMGRIVEQAPVGEMFANPQHPYTQALLRSLPGTHVGERKAELEVIEGSVPDPFQQMVGCPFHPRCREAGPGLCDEGPRPPLVRVADGHTTACRKREATGV